MSPSYARSRPVCSASSSILLGTPFTQHPRNGAGVVVDRVLVRLLGCSMRPPVSFDRSTIVPFLSTVSPACWSSTTRRPLPTNLPQPASPFRLDPSIPCLPPSIPYPPRLCFMCHVSRRLHPDVAWVLWLSEILALRVCAVSYWLTSPRQHLTETPYLWAVVVHSRGIFGVPASRPTSLAEGRGTRRLSEGDEMAVQDRHQCINRRT